MERGAGEGRRIAMVVDMLQWVVQEGEQALEVEPQKPLFELQV